MEDYEGTVEQLSPPVQLPNSTAKKTTARRTKTGGGQGRKSHACTECKRLKMRCEPLPAERRCSRCMRRGLECVYDRPYNPAMAFMPGACETKLDQIGQNILTIQTTLQNLVKERAAHAPIKNGRRGSPCGSNSSKGGATSPGNRSVPHPLSEDEDAVLSHTTTPRHTAMTRESSPVGRLDDEEISLARSVSMSQPMGSLYEVTRLRNLRYNQEDVPETARSSEGPIDDFISKGIIDEAEAEGLYQIFKNSLNHYLWVGLEQIHDSLESIRRSSTLLTATILTVTALHVPSRNETFDKAYDVFLDHISASMFARKHNVDDVRGLCIGAYWLSDVSWKLSGHAVRIATELGIHRSFDICFTSKGNREHFLRARLWYMLWVLDRHLSIAYGRPPMITDSHQVTEEGYERFLAMPLVDILDYRIISQVGLFEIVTRFYETLVPTTGLEDDELPVMVPESKLHYMEGFNHEIDAWRQKWTNRMEENRFIGRFPVVGITLYSYFGKLLLNSLALRGINMSENHFSPERRVYAGLAIDAAASILKYVLKEPDLRRAMVGTPLYVHTMITWASVFLMKIATRWRSAGFEAEPVWVWELLDEMIALLRNTMISDRHVLHYIAEGLQKMLDKSRAILAQEAAAHPPHAYPHPHHALKAEYDSSPTSMSYVPGNATGNGGPGGDGGDVYSNGNNAMANGLMHHAHAPHHGDEVSAAAAAYMDNMTGVSGSQAHWNQHYTTCGAEMQADLAVCDNLILNDSMIHDAFAANTGYGVYNLLQNQFSSFS